MLDLILIVDEKHKNKHHEGGALGFVRKGEWERESERMRERVRESESINKKKKKELSDSIIVRKQAYRSERGRAMKVR